MMDNYALVTENVTSITGTVSPHLPGERFSILSVTLAAIFVIPIHVDSFHPVWLWEAFFAAIPLVIFHSYALSFTYTLHYSTNHQTHNIISIWRRMQLCCSRWTLLRQQLLIEDQLFASCAKVFGVWHLHAILVRVLHEVFKGLVSISQGATNHKSELPQRPMPPPSTADSQTPPVCSHRRSLAAGTQGWREMRTYGPTIRCTLTYKHLFK